MIVRNKIWEEIKQTKANAICAQKYSTVQRRIDLVYKVMIPLLSALCVLFSTMEWYDKTLCSAIVLFVSSTAKAIFPKLILPEKSILALDELYKAFNNSLTDLESLFHNLDNNTISENDAVSEISKLIKSNAELSEELNRLVLWIPAFADKRITEETEYYLNATYNNKFE